jgi:hypothetical protein
VSPDSISYQRSSSHCHVPPLKQRTCELIVDHHRGRQGCLCRRHDHVLCRPPHLEEARLVLWIPRSFLENEVPDSRFIIGKIEGSSVVHPRTDGTACGIGLRNFARRCRCCGCGCWQPCWTGTVGTPGSFRAWRDLNTTCRWLSEGYLSGLRQPHQDSNSLNDSKERLTQGTS